MSDRYCIKPGYEPNPPEMICESNSGEAYWSEHRIKTSAAYQYYVYTLARRLMSRYGFTSFLDVGSGPGTKTAQLIAPICQDIVLVDQQIAAQLTRNILPGARFVEADLEIIDLQMGRTFQLIVCADVLEHLLDPTPCVNFIRRHLANDGLALISTPERDLLLGPSCMFCPKREHVREWNSVEFAQYLNRCGLSVRRHLWYPQRRIGTLEFIASRVVTPLYKLQRWCACQTVVCDTSHVAR